MKTFEPEQVGFSSERMRRIDTLLQRYVDEGKIAGILAAVARRGQTAYWHCFGMMDIEAGKSMQFDTLFRIYSMTKPITSAAMMMLYEQGHFQLNDPVARFIPGFKDVKVLNQMTESGPDLVELDTDITIWHLLTHTSGLSYGFEEADPIDKIYQESLSALEERNQEITLELLIQELTQVPLAFQPGNAWRYSLATDVLGYLVQVISGQPFDDFLKQNIFEPLGMVDTDFYVPENKIARFAANYGPGENGGLQMIDSPATSKYASPTKNPSGGGGLISTAVDYLQFAQMMLNKGELNGAQLLGRKTVEMMTMDHLGGVLHPFDDPAHGMGLGVGVLINVAQSREPGSIGLYGWGGAANTFFWIDPEEALIGLLLLQFMPNNVYPVTPDFKVAVYQSLVD